MIYFELHKFALSQSLDAQVWRYTLLALNGDLCFECCLVEEHLKTLTKVLKALLILPVIGIDFDFKFLGVQPGAHRMELFDFSLKLAIVARDHCLAILAFVLLANRALLFHLHGVFVGVDLDHLLHER